MGSQVTFRNRPEKRVYGFLLLDQYPLLPVAGMIDILRDADYVTDRVNHQWFTISVDSREVVAMNGLRSICDYTVETAPQCDVVVVCAALGGHLFEDDRLFRWLRSRYAQHTTVGAIATGTWVLAKAGLLSNHRCTLHWEDIPAFEEQYPRLTVERSLFVRDRQIFTCSGGTAAIDLFLQLVSETLGPEVSSDVARQILYQTIRQGSEVVPIKESPFRRIGNQALRKAAQLMHDNVDFPLSIETIAARSGTSQKQLERLFDQHFRTTPQLHYRAVRLDQARALVRLTEFAIWEIAIATGFSTPQYLSKCYRARFGISPSQERRNLARYQDPLPSVVLHDGTS
ncbi:GlxA family transcriptional regulator [Mesorhizobium sp. ZC-5]|nr:GlxA family transcriptional regulator [Mesorhizobium sp. ZC-5]MCV3244046.1 GlxA family transcriptional regulator [Mesorhizobium sp. ZC-5]